MVQYETYRAGAGAAGYLLPQPNPFDNWYVSQRYANESSFSQHYTEVHRQGAALVQALISKADLEGILVI